MKSNVCKKANEFIKQGFNRSDAFRKAWALVKVESIEDELHWLCMADRFNPAERRRFDELNGKMNMLQRKANSIMTAEQIEAEKRYTEERRAAHRAESDRRYETQRKYEKEHHAYILAKMEAMGIKRKAA